MQVARRETPFRRGANVDVAMLIAEKMLETTREKSTYAGSTNIGSTDSARFSQVCATFRQATHRLVPSMIRVLPGTPGGVDSETHYFMPDGIEVPNERRWDTTLQRRYEPPVLQAAFPRLEHLQPFINKLVTDSTASASSSRIFYLHFHGRQSPSWTELARWAVEGMSCRAVVFSRSPPKLIVEILRGLLGGNYLNELRAFEVRNDYKLVSSERGNNASPLPFEQDGYDFDGAARDALQLQAVTQVVTASIPDSHLPVFCRVFPCIKRLEITGLRRDIALYDSQFLIKNEHPFAPLHYLAPSLTTLVIDRGAVLPPYRVEEDDDEEEDDDDGDRWVEISDAGPDGDWPFAAITLPNVTSLTVFEETSTSLFRRLRSFKLKGLRHLDFGISNGSCVAFRRYEAGLTVTIPLEELFARFDRDYPQLSKLTIRNLDECREVLRLMTVKPASKRVHVLPRLDSLHLCAHGIKPHKFYCFADMRNMVKSRFQSKRVLCLKSLVLEWDADPYEVDARLAGFMDKWDAELYGTGFLQAYYSDPDGAGSAVQEDADEHDDATVADDFEFFYHMAMWCEEFRVVQEPYRHPLFDLLKFE